MKCPHCGITINLELYSTSTWAIEEKEDEQQLGYNAETVKYGHCPACEQVIVFLVRGYSTESGSGFIYISESDVSDKRVIYPLGNARSVDNSVPKRYRQDFLEACSVVNLSPKASAAISRRLLQDILREHFKVKPSDLSKEIDAFLALGGIPSYLAEDVDAIRNVGNFAAHPMKDTSTGQIIDVEPGEAEWLLDVLESLFDFAYIQPALRQQRKSNLNNKLGSVGKPPMK